MPKPSPSLLLSALICSLLPLAAHAEDAAPLTGNVALTTDYRFRGISQTRLDPALQLGADYAVPGTGFYIGAWASTIKWIKDYNVRGSVELDLYGGYKGEISPGLGYDVGILQYAYVNNKLADAGGGGVFKNADTTEIYGALSYNVFIAKLSYALTNLFGNYNFATNQRSDGSYYFEVAANVDLGNGFTLVPHIGHQKVRHIDNASYTDYSLTLTKDLGSGFSVSGAVVGTNANESFYVPGPAANSNKFLGKTAGVLSVKYVF